jgi:MerR family transcriptional regulator, copper efflux regulator
VESQEGYDHVVRIGEVAVASNVSVKTIRYYEHLGVLTPAAREPNGYRSYEPAVLDRLAFIRSAQSIGLALGEIRETLAFRDQGHPPCAHVLNLIEQHAADLSERIRDLKETRRALETLAARGRALNPEQCRPETICHVIPPTN